MIQGCELCGERDETRDHLYFACPYSYMLWEAPARKIVGSGVNPYWQWTLQRLQAMGTKGVDSCVVRLFFQTLIYHIWRERNARRHQQRRHSIEQMRRLIDKAMRNKIYSLKYKSEHKLGGMLRRWFEITLDIDLYKHHRDIANRLFLSCK